MKPTKLDVCKVLLMNGSVFIHLDPRTPGVVVPLRLMKQSQVVLQWGLDMPVPIPDMQVDSFGISGTLSFKGNPFHCSIPWEAVFAVVGENAKGMVWEENMPSEIKAQISAELDAKVASMEDATVVQLDPSRARKFTPRVTSKPGADRSHLKLVR